MKITNPNGLPECLVRSVSPDPNKVIDPHRMSITDLINPPMIRYLRQQHHGEMEERVDDMVWMMLGTAFHSWVEKFSPDNAEVKIEYEFAGFTIVGIVDLIEGRTVCDYKVTSTYSFLLGEKPEWEAQLNCYAWLLAQRDQKIDGLKIIAILRDWQASKAKYDSKYPQSAIMQHKVKLWSEKKQEQYVQDRIEAHKRRLGCAPRACTNEEMWYKGDTFAVKVQGVRSAKRVLSTETEAQEWAEKNIKGKFEIEFRQGEYNRCKSYCSVRNFCPNNIYADGYLPF